MPIAAPTACARCRQLQPCACQQQYQRDRGSSCARGYGRRWQRYRLAFLRDNPICMDPYHLHRIPAPAECVDHIVPHRGDFDLFWAERNHQPLCLACNSRKCATEEGGFGHGN